ncbi:hypothetical protein [Thiobacillus sp.]|nr:hypothetical protein [Thiobacillus sp.]
MNAWNLLGGLDWSGVQLVAEILGIEDMELFVDQLAMIRNHQRKD